jgi:methionyl-tRNA formyltransferase
MRLDEKMDEGPIVAQENVDFPVWPVPYREAEAKLGTAGGTLLARILPDWVDGTVNEVPQDSSRATYTKKIKREDADITNDSPATALRKIYAYEVWPRARLGDLIITAAHIENDSLVIDRVIPPGKKEMPYADYLRGHK